MIELNKKYRTRSGQQVRLYATDAGEIFPVHGAISTDGENWFSRSWTKEGRLYADETENSGDLFEAGPFDHIKIDDKVLVWFGGDEYHKFKRYFAGVSEDGRPMTFVDGATSWSSGGLTIEWDNCELYLGE